MVKLTPKACRGLNDYSHIDHTSNQKIYAIYFAITGYNKNLKCFKYPTWKNYTENIDVYENRL